MSVFFSMVIPLVIEHTYRPVAVVGGFWLFLVMPAVLVVFVTYFCCLLLAHRFSFGDLFTVRQILIYSVFATAMIIGPNILQP